MAYSLPITYYNSFWIKKVTPVSLSTYSAEWPGIPWLDNIEGYPAWPFIGMGLNVGADVWYLEESRIRGGYNNTSVDLGVRAYITDEEPQQSIRGNALTYSGIYNSRTGINSTNQFPSGESISKALDPQFGSIQKLYAEDSNLTVFQEYKVSRALIDKDTIYTTEGGTQTQAAGKVLGQVVPYVGEYGISQNPESFAQYGYRRYFADKNKGLVLRLSRDGIEEISRYGMRDYFRDYLASVPDGWQIQYTEELVGTRLDEVTVEITTGTCCSIETGMFLQVSNPWQVTNPGSNYNGGAGPVFHSGISTTTTSGVGVGLIVDCKVIYGTGAISMAVASTPGSGYVIGDTVTIDNIGGAGGGSCTLTYVGAKMVWDTVLGGVNPSNSVGPIWVIAVVDNGDGTCNISFSGYFAIPSWFPSTTTPQDMRFGRYVKSQITGGFDIHNQNYIISPQAVRNDPIPYTVVENPYLNTYSTLAFDEEVRGWTSFFDYKPRFINSLINKYYTIFDSSIYQHHSETPSNNRCNFYGSQNDASIIFVFNPNPSVIKNFQTINYEGSSGWKAEYFQGDFEGINTVNAGVTWTQKQDVTNNVMSYIEGQYDSNTPTPNYGLLATVQPILHAGFNRRENKYVANLVNRSTVRPGEVVFWDGSAGEANPISGIKGYYTTVKMTTDQTTQLGGSKELYAVSSKWVVSSQ